MKNRGFLSLALAIGIPFQANAETLDKLVTRDRKEYLKVEIVTADAVGLKIRHESGTARIPYDELPANLQEKYKFDPAKAAAQKAQEARQQALHDKEQGTPVTTLPSTKPAPSSVVESSEPDLVQLNVAEVADDAGVNALESYIVDLRVKIETAAKKCAELRAAACEEREKFRTIEFDAVDVYGRVDQRTRLVQDKSGFARARKSEKLADDLDKRIEKALQMVGRAETKFRRLTGGEFTLSIPGGSVATNDWTQAHSASK